MNPDTVRTYALPRITGSIVLGATGICTFIGLAFVIVFPSCAHWFVIPVVLSGILVTCDAILWLRGRYDLFDPFGMLGAFGVLFFFLNPLLMIACEAEMVYVDNVPIDWRPWLGIMACLNLLGLALFFWVRKRVWTNKIEFRTKWKLAKRRFYPIMLSGMLFSLALQVFFFIRSGGISGVIDRETGVAQGQGFLFLFSESFPILLFLFLILLTRVRERKWSTASLYTICVLVILTQFFLGGLRGSRSNTLGLALWIAGIVHLTQKKISIKLVIIAMPVVLAFLASYGLYKHYRGDVVYVVQSVEDYKQAASESNRTFTNMLLGDLGRTDVQALICQRLIGKHDYDLAYGETYISALLVMVPGNLRPKLRTKTSCGTEIIYGKGDYEQRLGVVTSRVFGLAGEAMLNFGIIAAPLAFIVLALVFSWLRQFMYSLDRDDLRMLLVPLLLRGALYLFFSDLNNLVFALVKNGAFPFLIILLLSYRVPLRTRSK